MGREIFGSYLTREMDKLLYLAFTERAVLAGVPESNVRALVNFYKHGLVGVLLDWVDKGLVGDIEEIVQLYRPVFEEALDEAFLQMSKV
jgi:hypothetical protein